MQMNIKADVNINANDLAKVSQDQGFWMLAAQTWHKLYRPYCPFKEGALYSSVAFNAYGSELKAEIEHSVPYAHYVYEGQVYGPNIPIMESGHVISYFSPPKKHPTGRMMVYSGTGTRHWDEAAIPTQQAKLIQTLQDYINSKVI